MPYCNDSNHIKLGNIRWTGAIEFEPLTSTSFRNRNSQPLVWKISFNICFMRKMMRTWKKFIADRKVYYDMTSVFLVKLIKFFNLFLNISNDIIHMNFCIIILHTCDMPQSTGANYIIKIKNKQWPLTGTLFFQWLIF